tara:strand:- start:61 stop:174 length:114 start_codon:yes stop_codon:yes gene_type:complete
MPTVPTNGAHDWKAKINNDINNIIFNLVTPNLLYNLK